jgi:hypothetical protein
MREYEYNILKDDIFYIKDEYKKKGKEYGIAKLSKNQIQILTEIIDLISVAPLLSIKFSKTIEEFLHPRFQELTGALYANKALPDLIGIEFSKDNYKDLLSGLKFPNVEIIIKNKNYPIGELTAVLDEIKFVKYK